MTTYNTGNALGSSDARDLYDNAENFDNFANGAANTYRDRLGVTRKSLAGMNAAFDDFIESSGYTVPVAYASGIVLTEYNQLIEYNDEFYKLKAGQAPYTTTGTWGTDSAKLVAVGDAALRQELTANANDFNLLPEIANYAALRAYTGDVTSYYVRGVANIFDGGAGVFRVDASDTTTADNGGTVLVDASGRRWKREFSGAVNVRWFGATGNSITDDTAAIQAAIDSFVPARGSVLIPNGTYLISNTITIKSLISLVGSSGTLINYSGFSTNVFNFKAGAKMIGNGMEIFVNNNTWNGAVLYFYGDQQYDGKKNTFVEGVHIKANGTPNGKAIHLDCTGAATDWIEYVSFENILIYRLRHGIRIDCGTGGQFVNGNTFQNIRFFENVQPIYVSAGTVAGNVFDNLMIQMFPTATIKPIELVAGSRNYITNVWLWDWPAASGNPISLPANAQNYLTTNIAINKITNSSTNQCVDLSFDSHSSMIVDQSLTVRSALQTTWASPNNKTFIFSGGINGSAAFLTIEASQWNGYKRSYFTAINSAGNWIVTEIVNTTNGTVPVFTITNNNTPQVILTTNVSTTFSGGFMTINMARSFITQTDALSGVDITGTSGEFSCNAAALSLGRAIRIAGTFGGTGSITGYTNPKTYYIIATNGTTSFQLSETPGGPAITTTAGTPTGLVYVFV